MIPWPLPSSYLSPVNVIMSGLVPSAPPRNIRTSLLDNKTLILHWEPPAKQHRNGVLYGYKVFISFVGFDQNKLRYISNVMYY